MNECPIFRFRLRCQFERGRTLQDFEGPVGISLPGIGHCELKPVNQPAQNDGHSLALLGPPRYTKERASQDGELALGNLLQSSLRLGFGVLIQPRKPEGVITSFGMEWIAQQFEGINTLYRDSLGLTVFEEKGETRFVSMGNAEISVTTIFQNFIDEWNSEIPASLSRRNLIAYELYASSRFETSSRARFLLLVMAIEALAKQSKRPDNELIIIEELLNHVAHSSLEDSRRRTLMDGLRSFKNISIGETCKVLITKAQQSGAIKDPEAAKHFRDCYRIRGQIVHSGKTPSPSAITNESNRLEKTVRELVGWAFQQPNTDDENLWPSEFARFV